MRYGYHLYSWREYSTAVFTLSGTFTGNSAMAVSGSKVKPVEAAVDSGSGASFFAINMFNVDLDVNAISHITAEPYTTINMYASTSSQTVTTASFNVKYDGSGVSASSPNMSFILTDLYNVIPKENETYTVIHEV